EQRMAMSFRLPPPEPGNRGERPPGPPRDEPPRERPNFHMDPEHFRQKLREALQRAALNEADTTNSFYFVMWQCEGNVLARSSNGPVEVPMPQRTEMADSRGTPGLEQNGPGGPRKAGPGPSLFSSFRTRGTLRETFKFTPFG